MLRIFLHMAALLRIAVTVSITGCRGVKMFSLLEIGVSAPQLHHYLAQGLVCTEVALTRSAGRGLYCCIFSAYGAWIEYVKFK